MGNINFQQIIDLLMPTSQTMLFDIMLYIIFFLTLIALFLVPNKNMVPTLLIAASMLFAIVAKLSLGAIYGPGDPIFQRTDFGMLVINAGMFTFPLVAVGLTRTRKSAKSTPPAVLAALVAGAYFALFWLIHQRG